jgi:hypothetical protein
MLGDEIARQAWAELQSGRRALSGAEVEGIAALARACLAALDPPRHGAEGIAAALGFVVVRAQLPPEVPGIHAAGMIFARPQRDAARGEAIIYHETSHGYLRRVRLWHEHPDVWALALALGCPLEVVRAHRGGSPLDLAAACEVPCWFAWMRLVTVEEHTALRVA